MYQSSSTLRQVALKSERKKSNNTQSRRALLQLRTAIKHCKRCNQALWFSDAVGGSAGPDP